MDYYIYGLFRPNAELPFYVGATTNPESRKQDHAVTYQDFKLLILKTLDTEHATRKAEAELIRHYKLRGGAGENRNVRPHYVYRRGVYNPTPVKQVKARQRLKRLSPKDMATARRDAKRMAKDSVATYLKNLVGTPQQRAAAASYIASKNY